jgi:hypothetical protein
MVNILIIAKSVDHDLLFALPFARDYWTLFRLTG